MGLVDTLKGGDKSASSDELQFKTEPAPNKDKAPKSRSAPSATAIKKTATTAELKKIEDALTEFLSMPAMGCDLKGDEWPAEHIRGRSPELAKRITTITAHKPEFREQLLKLIDGGMWGPLVFAGVMYILPLGVYYELIPLPVPARMALAGGTPIKSEMDDAGDDAVHPDSDG